MSIEIYLDELQRFADREFHTELLAARVEYFAGLRQVYEEDDLFEAHLDRFLDWFLFDRVLPQTGQTTLSAFIERQRGSLAPETMAIYEGFLSNLHGLFEVRKTTKDGVHLRELALQTKFFVADDAFGAFTKGQIFDARLLPLHGEWRFGKGSIFHPLAATKAILKRLKQIDAHDPEARRAFIRDLALRRLRADRYKHVDPEQFYRF
jgi:hypothetical protein